MLIPKDLLTVMNLLKNKKIQYFDKRIPVMLLHLIYTFFWNILYLAKTMSSYRGYRKMRTKDIDLACIFFEEKLQKKHNHGIKNLFLPRYNNSMLLGKIFKKSELKASIKKKSFRVKNLRIV